MKRILLSAAAALAVCWSAPAQVDFDVDFDFDIYPDYYNDYDDDLYRYGFNINNYAYQYEEVFIRQVWRDYGISRTVVRGYLRAGFSPSDILFAAELAYRTGNRFQYILDGYYRSPSRDWVDISFSLGIPWGSSRFNLILGSFNRYYRYWGNYYHRYHPHGLPPMYHNGWSYFRPSPTPHRPPLYSSPDYRRRPQVSRPGYNGRPENNVPNVRPGSSSGNSMNSVRPGNSSGNAQGTAAQPDRTVRPAPSNGGDYRRESSSGASSGTVSPASPSRRRQASPSAAPSRSSGARSGSSSSTRSSPAPSVSRSSSGGSSRGASPARSGGNGGSSRGSSPSSSGRR